MIRSLSLILRAAHDDGLVLGGRQEAVGLAESPWLMHLLDHGTPMLSLPSHRTFLSRQMDSWMT